MKLFITAAVLASTLSSGAIANSLSLPITPIKETIIGDSYTAYEATKTCANELFYNPHNNQLFDYESGADQNWQLTYFSQIQLNTGTERFKTKITTRVEDDKILVNIGAPSIVDAAGNERGILANPQAMINPLEEKLYDTYESFMICISDF